MASIYISTLDPVIPDREIIHFLIDAAFIELTSDNDKRTNVLENQIFFKRFCVRNKLTVHNKPQRTSKRPWNQKPTLRP